METFNNMVHELQAGRSNPDGADQGFIGGYFPDLLDKPMFHPPSNGTLDGTYRLPLGYQMDASYYCKHPSFTHSLFKTIFDIHICSSNMFIWV